MTSNRPYLIRAVYEWIADNDMTPHLLVDAQHAGLRVPVQAVKDGRVVLNIGARAVNQLELGNEEIRFLARFGGVSQSVRVPLPAILAIYALESGQGMALPEEGGANTTTTAAPALATGDSPPESPDGDGKGGKRGPHLRVVK
jgi:stringent starvation protein B